MKADLAQMGRALDSADPAFRLFLLYGPDEATSRDLAGRLGRAVAGDAERIDLTGAALKADPALLADEAAAFSLFGGARHIRVDPAGDEILDAVQALMDAPSTGNPVVVVSGVLRKDSKLLKLILANPLALAFVSYVPEGIKADQVAIEIARSLGVQLQGDAARRIVSANGTDRALMSRELEKIALFIDATPESPRPAGPDVLDAIGAANEESDVSAIVDAVLGGQTDRTSAELALIGSTEAIGVVRALLRRLAQIAPLRAEVAAGNSIDSVMASSGRGIFWKDQKVVSGLLARWSPDAIATATLRLAATERAFKRSGSAGMVMIGEELLAISRAAAARRRR